MEIQLNGKNNGFNSSINKWKSYIIKEGKAIFERTFLSEEEACRFRDLYIIINLPNSHYKKNLVWSTEDINEWAKKFGL